MKKLAYLFYILAAVYVISPIDIGPNLSASNWRARSIPTALLIGAGLFCMQKHKKDSFKFTPEDGEEFLWQRSGFYAACGVTIRHIYCHYYMSDSMKKDLLKNASKEAFYPTETLTKIQRSEIARIGKGKSKLREIMVIEMKDGSKITPPIWGRNLQELKDFLSV